MLLLCSTTFPLVYTTEGANYLASVMNRPADGLSFLDRQLKLNTREDAEELAAEIAACPQLTFLELRGNTLGIQAGERIAEALEKHPELKYALWSDLFTGRLKNEIPPILRSMCGAMMRAGTCLTELDLSDNAFGPIGAEGIQDFLCSPSAFELKTLRLNNNGLGAGGVIIANCLLAAHRNAAAAGRRFALKTFVAGRNRLEDPGAIALAKAFKAIGTLEEITVPQNGIRKDGIKALARCLGSNRALRVINFNDNTCTRIGAIEISFSLGDLTQLEVLDLGDCLCRANGTTAILSVLVSRPFPKLREVNLSGNELPTAVVRDVLGAWTRRPTQTKLRVTNNGFGGEWADLAEEIEQRALAELVDMGAESDDEGTADEESAGESEESDEEERTSRQGSDEEPEGAMDPLADAMRTMAVQQPAAAAPAAQAPPAAAAPAAPAAPASGPYELSFLDKQLKFESEADAEVVAAALAAHPEVTSFVLRGNTLGIGAGERIAQALEKCPNLKDCNWSDLFTGRLRSEIPIIVKRLCGAMRTAGVQLRSLDLSDNAFGPIGAESIQDFLESESAFSLEELRLNNCGLGAGAVTVANSLLTLHQKARAAGRKLNLRVIVAGRNRLEIPGALAFARAIGEIGTLEELTVHQNGIHRPGVIGLAEGVARNPRMARLSIADNVGGWEGAEAFAQALQNLRELESADFSDCLSKDRGCRALVQAAVRLPKLKVLNLSGSELTAGVAEQLVTAWSQGRNDTATLNISTNNLSDQFGRIRDLAESLGGRVDVGESDDDCGSLSGDEAEDGAVDEDVNDDTSDGERNSGGDDDEDEDEEEKEYYDFDDEEEDEDDYSDEDEDDDYDQEEEEAIAEAKGRPAVSSLASLQASQPMQQLLQAAQHITVAGFCAAPTAAGLRALAAAGSERLKKMIEPFAGARDQTESARLFLSVIVAASGAEPVTMQAVEVLDTLLITVSRHLRRPIPTVVQMMNHVVAHSDMSINREENLVDPSAISRTILETAVLQLTQRGRLTEASNMIGHYFPSTLAAAAAPGAAAAPPARQTFAFNFSAVNTAATTGLLLILIDIIHVTHIAVVVLLHKSESCSYSAIEEKSFGNLAN
ncbi:ran-2 [Pristionchus pacificus]|uniref:Ran-2 n=1 Tax=Pristionchus pacificus TaxID=54126 RepID=A0A2A6C9B7_PRIPA|nr:ran-2 [Pristionchus pacificus]|eukprot:PDM74749.1 ran-2 [Pristionchus pacificus]